MERIFVVVYTENAYRCYYKITGLNIFDAITTSLEKDLEFFKNIPGGVLPAIINNMCIVLDITDNNDVFLIEV